MIQGPEGELNRVAPMIILCRVQCMWGGEGGGEGGRARERERDRGREIERARDRKKGKSRTDLTELKVSLSISSVEGGAALSSVLAVVTARLKGCCIIQGTPSASTRLSLPPSSGSVAQRCQLQSLTLSFVYCFPQPAFMVGK